VTSVLSCSSSNSIEHIRAYVKLPEYFRTHTHDDLFDLKKSPFAYALGLEGMTYYEAISHDPDRFNMFNMTMTQMESQVPVLGMYPFGSLRNEVEADKERPFIVDVGGGRGHALVAIQKEAPAGARMILQDRPDVIGSLMPEDIPNIETMVYDFFTPQPIKSILLPLQLVGGPTDSSSRRPPLSPSPYPARLLRASLHPDPKECSSCHGPNLPVDCCGFDLAR
jgi:hypothetical protein